MQVIKTLTFAAVLFGAAAAAGCQTDKSSMTDFFPAEEERKVQHVANIQAASGARADPTLQPFHFDGGKLNSLGEAKLDLMLKDDDAIQPLVVYMNVPDKDATYAARCDAVLRYLHDRGATADQVKLEVGPNPNVHSLASEHLSRMSRTENNSASGGSSSTTEGSTTGAESAPMAPPAGK
jgi:hypothetical protein